MTIMEQVLLSPETDVLKTQRFVLDSADWALYQRVLNSLENRRVFATYYKGRLELVTVSLIHERIAGLLALIIRALAEEAGVPLIGAGMTTLQRPDLDEGVEADASFYIAHAKQMVGKETLDLTVDPPPDLAVEVEITRRLGARKLIYRDLGVPEIWRYGDGGLTFLVRQGEEYQSVNRSPTFPLFSPEELSGFVTAGVYADETTWIISFRRRVREILKKP